MSDIQEQLRVLKAGTVDLINHVELEAKLREGRSLRVKLGIDPTASDIHLGFAVVLRKLRQFQDFGHTAVLIIGDFTAQIGDPTGQSKTRPRLPDHEIELNAQTYVRQITKILRSDPSLVEVRRNSEWLSEMGMEDVLELSAKVTVARLLERDDFSRRLSQGSAISLMELLYPLLQGLDSVHVGADVELGGTDQLYNNLVGRDLQRAAGQPPQVVITTPILEGIDGSEKMAKSLKNYVGISEPPHEQFGKLMKIPDTLVPKYFELTTGWHPDDVQDAIHRLANGELRPVDAKRLLARTVVDLYHGKGAGQRAEAEFDRVFKNHEAPSNVRKHVLHENRSDDMPIPIVQLLADSRLVASRSEGRRMVSQGAVRINGEQVHDPELKLNAEALDGALVQVGRRKWVQIELELE